MGWLMALLMLFQTNTPPLCRVLDTLNIGEVVEWSNAAYERGELPDDLRMLRFIYLTDPTLPAEQLQALEFEYSAAREDVYLFAYYSLRVGDDGGNHDLCPVRVLHGVRYV